MAEMNTPTVLKQATRDCSPSCDNRSVLTHAYILTELQVLNLIIVLNRGVEPMKRRQVWRKRHGNMLKPNYNLKSTNTCHPTCYLFLPDLSSSDLEMRKGSKSFFTRSNNVWCEIVSVAERPYSPVALFPSLQVMLHELQHIFEKTHWFSKLTACGFLLFSIWNKKSYLAVFLKSCATSHTENYVPLKNKNAFS